MRDDCVNYGSTEENSIVTPWIEMADYASAVGRRWMFITYMGVAEFPGTGENTTISFDVCAGDATRTDIKNAD